MEPVQLSEDRAQSLRRSPQETVEDRDSRASVWPQMNALMGPRGSASHLTGDSVRLKALVL